MDALFAQGSGVPPNRLHAPWVLTVLFGVPNGDQLCWLVMHLVTSLRSFGAAWADMHVATPERTLNKPHCDDDKAGLAGGSSQPYCKQLKMLEIPRSVFLANHLATQY
jgi:hypothetical protein